LATWGKTSSTKGHQRKCWPQAVRLTGATIRLGGIVQKGTVAWDSGHTELAFRVTNDATATALRALVTVRETPPQMFREGIGVVV